MAPRPGTKHPAARNLLVLDFPHRRKSQVTFDLPVSPGLPYMGDSERAVLETQLWGIRPRHGRQGDAQQCFEDWELRNLAVFSSYEFVFLHHKVQTSLEH